MNPILIAIIALGAIGLVAAAVLFLVSRKFAVHEDLRIGQVSEALPQANCGGCGYAGCAAFAAACVGEGLTGKFCPVGGQDVMNNVADILGQTVEAADPKVAVVRCNGTCEHRPRLVQYDGFQSCAISALTYGGDTGCNYGCLGCGDCVSVCQFDAIHINPETLIAEVDESKCTACGACVEACPKDIIELRLRGKRDRRVFVSCVNKDKGAVARKACDVSCIGCGKCAKVCPFDAITVENNLAYIDPEICKSCRKCVEVCPTGAIHEVNFPPRKAKPTVEKKPVPNPVVKTTTMETVVAPKKEIPNQESARIEYNTNNNNK